MAYDACKMAKITHPADAGDTQLPSRRIAADLRAAIESGELTAGQKLPSERELAVRYGTARNTAREAIRLLEASGLVEVQHGRGVFVRAPAPLIRLGSDRYSRRYRDSGLSPFLLECAKQGKAGRFQVNDIRRGQPPADIAADFGVAADEDSVLIRENVFWAGNDPVHAVTTYIPWAIADGTGLLEEDVPHPYGIHGILEERGHVMTRQVEDVSARMPTPAEEGALRLRPGIPVLVVRHVSIDANGTPYEVTRFVMRSDLTGLRYDVPIE
jgi:GntR family transcriptional regulator